MFIIIIFVWAVLDAFSTCGPSGVRFAVVHKCLVSGGSSLLGRRGFSSGGAGACVPLACGTRKQTGVPLRCEALLAPGPPGKPTTPELYSSASQVYHRRWACPQTQLRPTWLCTHRSPLSLPPASPSVKLGPTAVSRVGWEFCGSQVLAAW